MLAALRPDKTIGGLLETLIKPKYWTNSFLFLPEARSLNVEMKSLGFILRGPWMSVSWQPLQH